MRKRKLSPLVLEREAFLETPLNNESTTDSSASDHGRKPDFAVRIDHVNLGSTDLAATAHRIREQLGLGVEPFPDGEGGHIPLAGRQYIEIHTQRSHSFGDFIAHVARKGDRWWNWSVEVDELPSELARVVFDSRAGNAFTKWWGEHAGAAEAAPSRGLLPYFVRYGTPNLDELFEAKRAAAQHDATVGSITRVVIGPDNGRLTEWLGKTLPEVHVDPHVTGLSAVFIEVDGTEREVRLT